MVTTPVQAWTIKEPETLLLPGCMAFLNCFGMLPCATDTTKQKAVWLAAQRFETMAEAGLRHILIAATSRLTGV
ncbi:MAG: hypothetical protein ACOYNV_08325 [Propionivibrio sp.]